VGATGHQSSVIGPPLTRVQPGYCAVVPPNPHTRLKLASLYRNCNFLFTILTQHKRNSAAVSIPVSFSFHKDTRNERTDLAVERTLKTDARAVDVDVGYADPPYWFMRDEKG
jgi:hypothetical protein